MTREPRWPTKLRLAIEMMKRGSESQRDDALRMLQVLHEESPEQGARVVEALGAVVREQHDALSMARENHEALKELLEKLTQPPLHPAVFLGLSATPEWGLVAAVGHGGARTLVQVSDDFDPNELAIGDEVLLGRERNLVVGKSPVRLLESGETATFERFEGSRAVLRSRDEELIVTAATGLYAAGLEPGDRVRWDRSAHVAYERVSRAGELGFVIDSPDECFDRIGGLDVQIESLKEMFDDVRDPDGTRDYELRPIRSALLIGAPGTGKTMLARATATWLGEVNGGRPCFMHVKPGELHSMWHGESERRYREVFRAARKLASGEAPIPVVLFFDEVDSIAATRGDSITGVSDRILNAFMSELDGFDRRENVVVISATNRPEALDAGAVREGRLRDLVIEVPRPDRGAAAAILGKYFGTGVPYDVDGMGPNEARAEIIACAISRIYAPNGDSDLARLTFRDGRDRVVKARDLVSGALLARLADQAKRRARDRERARGARGVRREDVLVAVEERLRAAERVLGPRNCSQHVSGLPQDVDVVRVESIRPQARRASRFLVLDGMGMAS